MAVSRSESFYSTTDTHEYIIFAHYHFIIHLDVAQYLVKLAAVGKECRTVLAAVSRLVQS